MLKKFSVILLCICLVATCFAACSKDGESAETAGGLEENIAEYGFEQDEDGNTVAVVYEDGKAYVLDAEGNKTDQVIENPQNLPDQNDNGGSGSGSGNEVEPGTSPDRVTDREDVSNNTGDAPGTTDSELTTLPMDEDEVPNTSASGDPVEFNDKDVKTVTNMLEVPYLYSASYESNQNVPIEIATHVACWMLQRENLDTNNFASGTVVIDLFNYFARTVVSFKTKCNDYTGENTDAANPAPITYNSSNDTFSVTGSSYENRTHTVNITQIQDLGNNNYYKVIAEVDGIDSGCKSTSVVAVIQKNKLDTTLGFSIKALKWS